MRDVMARYFNFDQFCLIKISSSLLIFWFELNINLLFFKDVLSIINESLSIVSLSFGSINVL